jgi:hypothetical protein
MRSLNEMSVHDVIMFYYEKHHALRHGDMEKLRELKNRCPEIFDKANEAQIESMIAYAKAFQATDRYKELCRLELKSKLLLIRNVSLCIS